MRKAFLVLAVIASILIVSGSVAFATPAITFDNTTTENSLGNPPFTLGWEFQVNNSISVNGLGIFDGSQNGLVDSYEVGIFDVNGSLIISTIVDTNDPLTNQFRYQTITPTLLNAGSNYFIGALYLSGNDPLLFPGLDVITNFSSDPSLSFLMSSYNSGSTFSAPLSTLDTNPGYFGPNFTFDSVAPVPEPSTFILLGAGLAGLVAWRRKRS